MQRVLADVWTFLVAVSPEACPGRAHVAHDVDEAWTAVDRWRLSDAQDA